MESVRSNYARRERGTARGQRRMHDPARKCGEWRKYFGWVVEVNGDGRLRTANYSPLSFRPEPEPSDGGAEESALSRHHENVVRNHLRQTIAPRVGADDRESVLGITQGMSRNNAARADSS